MNSNWVVEKVMNIILTQFDVGILGSVLLVAPQAPPPSGIAGKSNSQKTFQQFSRSGGGEGGGGEKH